MKKLFRLVIGLGLALLVCPAFSQTNVTVTATVTDSDGTAWSNGTWTATYVYNVSQGTPSQNGVFFTTTYNGTMNGSGALSVSLASTTGVVPVTTPPATGWSFTICPQNSLSACATTAPIAIPNATDVSSTINAVIVAPRIGAGALSQGYADVNILNPKGGSQYFRLTDNTFRCYTTLWGGCGSGGGGTSPGGTNGALQYNASGAFAGVVITGLVKGNGTAAPSAATAGTDYVLPSGSITGTSGGLSGSPAITVSNVTDTALVNGNCVQAGAGGLLTTTTGACGSGGGGSVSITSSTGDVTVSPSPLTGTGTIDLNLGATNTWTALQTFGTNISIGGVTAGGATGTGSVVFGTSPTLSTPTIGAATATSINKVTITAPATSATLTVVNGGTLATAGAFTQTLTCGANCTPTFPSGSHTMGGLDVAESWSALQTFGTSISIGGVTAAGATGTNNVVFSSSPTLVTPALGTPSALVLTNATGLPFAQIVTGSSTATLTMGTTGTITHSGSGVINGTTVETAVSAANATYSLLAAASTSGDQEPVTVASLTVNPSTGNVNIPGTLTVGACSGCSAVSLSFPLTVSGTTTSGGIPYFSNATTLSTSAALASDALVIGGGAGGAPSTDTGCSTNGTGNLTCNQVVTNGSGGGSWTAVEGTAPSGVASSDILWADSTAHAWKANQNNGGAVFVTTNASALTSNAVVLGGGGGATSVVTGIVTDGATILELGNTGVTAGKVQLFNASTGSISLAPASGALGTVTATFPANTGTVGELNFAQTWSALQTFGTNISIGGVTTTGATGTGNVVFSISPTLTGTPDASGATQFKLPVTAGAATAANGELKYDSTALNWHAWGNGVDNLVALVPVSTTITNGDCTKWLNTSGVITIADAGSACGAGGAGGGGTSGWSGLPLTFASNVTQYVAAVGGTTASTTEAVVQNTAPASATISHLQVTLSAALGASATLAVTFRDGGASQALTCTTASGGTTCADNTHSYNMSQGDNINFLLVSSGSVTAGTPQIVISYAIGTSGVGVTSVAQTVPSGFSVAGSPITTSGTLAVTYNVAAGGQIIDSSAANTAGFTATPTLGASGVSGTLSFGNASSGLVTLGTVTGALGTVTASLPANTGTIGELNLAQTWSALQTFGANASIAATAHGVLLSENTSAVVATAASTTVTNALFATGTDPVFRNIGTSDVSPFWYVAGGGTANAQTATLSPALTALTAGAEVRWLPTAANSTTTPTLAVNGLTAATITKLGTAALAANDLTTTAIADAIYDGTRWQLQNPQTTSGGGGVTSFSGDGTIITNSASTGPVTTTIAGTSGGIPYFSSTSAWTSSALLANHNALVGGGAGNPPVSSAALYVAGTTNTSYVGVDLANTPPVGALETFGSVFHDVQGNTATNSISGTCASGTTTTCTLSASTGLPASGIFLVGAGAGSGTQEYVCGTISGTTFTFSQVNSTNCSATGRASWGSTAQTLTGLAIYAVTFAIPSSATTSPYAVVLSNGESCWTNCSASVAFGTANGIAFTVNSVLYATNNPAICFTATGGSKGCLLQNNSGDYFTNNSGNASLVTGGNALAYSIATQTIAVTNTLTAITNAITPTMQNNGTTAAAGTGGVLSTDCDVYWSQATGGTAEFGFKASAAPTFIAYSEEDFVGAATIAVQTPSSCATTGCSSAAVATSGAITPGALGTIYHSHIHLAMNPGTTNSPSVQLYGTSSSSSDVLSVYEGTGCRGWN